MLAVEIGEKQVLVLTTAMPDEQALCAVQPGGSASALKSGSAASDHCVEDGERVIQAPHFACAWHVASRLIDRPVPIPRIHYGAGHQPRTSPESDTSSLIALKGSTMNKKSRLTPVRFPVRAGFTPTPSPFNPTSVSAASVPRTDNFTRANDEARRYEELVRAYAAACEGRPRSVPATDRNPLHTLEGTGIELMEALYTGIVKVLFEDGGVEDVSRARVPCNGHLSLRCLGRA